MSMLSSQNKQDHLCDWTKLGLSLLTRRKNPQHGTLTHFNKMVLEQTRTGACVRSFGADSREQGFVLDWLLPGHRGNSVTEYLKDSYLEEGRNRAGFKPWCVKKQQSAQLAKIGGCCHRCCGLDNMHVLSVFRQVYRGVLILSWFIVFRVALCDVDILWNYLRLKEEHQGIAVDACLALGCPGLLSLGHEAWDCQMRSKESQKGKGRRPRPAFLSEAGCLCRSIILGVKMVFLSSINMTPKLHVKRKGKKR